MPGARCRSAVSSSPRSWYPRYAVPIRTALNVLLTAPEFQALEDRLRAISAFHILGIERRELSHAMFLAWLLDPGASHGMGSAPLRRFMLTASSLATTDTMIDATDVDALDLDVLAVETEVFITVPGTSRNRRLDVLVSLPRTDDDQRGQPVLVVEYKVDADEGEDQTADYAVWSRDRAFDLGGRRVLPLQVFLCPARGDGKEPAAPFVSFDYDSYVAWLDAVAGLDKTDQANFLLREFRSCLAQRADVADEEQNALVAKLKQDHGDVIQLLRDAPVPDLSHLSVVLSKHEEVFNLLGVTRRRSSKGYSPVIDALRSACQQQFEEGFWRIGGAGSMAAIFLPMVDKVRRYVGSDKLGMTSALRIHYYADRPTNERCRLCLEVIGDLPGLDAAANKALRNKLAVSLREHMPDDLTANPGRGAIVFAIRIPVVGVHGIDDDTDQRATAVEDALQTAAKRAKDVEGPLTVWIEQVLPALLPRET